MFSIDVIEMESATLVQILDEAVCISFHIKFHTNTLEKGILFFFLQASGQ